MCSKDLKITAHYFWCPTYFKIGNLSVSIPYFRRICKINGTTRNKVSGDPQNFLYRILFSFLESWKRKDLPRWMSLPKLLLLLFWMIKAFTWRTPIWFMDVGDAYSGKCNIQLINHKLLKPILYLRTFHTQKYFFEKLFIFLSVFYKHRVANCYMMK